MADEINIMTRPQPGTAKRIESREMVAEWAFENQVLLPLNYNINDWMVEINLCYFIIPDELFRDLFIDHDDKYLVCICHAWYDHECGCVGGESYGTLENYKLTEYD